jgi:HK97 family phage major capsid protein
MDPRIQALNDRRTELHGKCKALSEKETAGTALTAEEVAEFDAMVAEMEAIPAKISAVREEIRAAEQRRNRVSSMANTQTASPRRTAGDSLPNAPAPMATTPAWENDPAKGFKSPREFILAVIDVGSNSSRIENYDNLKYLTAGSDEQRGNSDPYGGFLVPEAFSPDLLTVKPEDDWLAGMTTKIPMKSPIVPIPARTDKDHTTSVSGGLTVTRKPETVAATSSVMQLERVVLNATNLFGLSYASEEILTDSPISFAAILAQGYGQQFGAQLIKERLRGTGVGEYQGVINAPGTVTVSAMSNQQTKTITKENIDQMHAQCWGYEKAVWITNYDCLPQLSSIVQNIGVAGSLVPYFQTDMASGKSYLKGRPVIFTEFASTLGTVGDLILGNWSEYLEGIYQPMQSAESMHVRFINHERTFKFWTRNAGQFWWKSALTPQNGANKLSPMCVLATR